LEPKPIAATTCISSYCPILRECFGSGTEPINIPAEKQLDIGKSTRRLFVKDAHMTKSVLIVDDNAFVRQALCQLFERDSDLEICGEAEDGRQAIAAATFLHPDLVILDISMPVMNGLDAARVLRALMPTLPVILYSAGVDNSVELEARSIGTCEVVSKGGPVSVLISKARDLLYRAAA
jgi:two-component system, chemotaxis family, chemotaxis protein CheY